MTVRCDFCDERFPADEVRMEHVCLKCSVANIPALQAEVERYREALEKMVAFGKECDENWSGLDHGERYLVGIATKALESEE